jgi:hypothetical protein
MKHSGDLLFDGGEDLTTNHNICFQTYSGRKSSVGPQFGTFALFSSIKPTNAIMLTSRSFLNGPLSEFQFLRADHKTLGNHFQIYLRDRGRLELPSKHQEQDFTLQNAGYPLLCVTPQISFKMAPAVVRERFAVRSLRLQAQ